MSSYMLAACGASHYIRCRRMKVIHVLPGLNRERGGPPTSVPALCLALKNAGVDVAIHTLDWETGVREFSFPVTCHPFWRFPRRLGVSPAMRRGLAIESQTADLVHNHGIWMMPAIYAERAARLAKVPFVLAPRGMLAPPAVAYSRVKKWIMWFLLQRSSLLRASCLHATSDLERQDLRRLGFRMPIAVIPNGVEPASRSVQRAVVTTRKRVLSLGRLDKKKGLENLLRAWNLVEADAPDWELVICGPGPTRYLESLRSLSRRLMNVRVEFLDARYGEEKTDVFASANVFVLPSFDENFGMVVGEALAHGLPVITTKRTPWRWLEETRVGWWIDIGVPPLADALRSALSTSADDLRAMGERGRDFVARHYSWSSVGEKMRKTYEWLLGGGSAPSWVETGA
ncbi:MAG: glycosyltransferase [Deltaproteobacteria bacterium]|nr:glycosyltransferase [Deltaproteobacteria bacterium]